MDFFEDIFMDISQNIPIDVRSNESVNNPKSVCNSSLESSNSILNQYHSPTKINDINLNLYYGELPTLHLSHTDLLPNDGIDIVPIDSDGDRMGDALALDSLEDFLEIGSFQSECSTNKATSNYTLTSFDSGAGHLTSLNSESPNHSNLYINKDKYTYQKPESNYIMNLHDDMHKRQTIMTYGFLKTPSPPPIIEYQSLIETKEANKHSLETKLSLRRPVNELIDQGIIPPLQTSGSIYEKQQKLERSRMTDILKQKIQRRPDRAQLVQQHILEETCLLDPLVAQQQKRLKRARLREDLNDKLAHRPERQQLVNAHYLIPSPPSLNSSIATVFPNGNQNYGDIASNSSICLSNENSIKPLTTNVLQQNWQGNKIVTGIYCSNPHNIPQHNTYDNQYWLNNSFFNGVNNHTDNKNYGLSSPLNNISNANTHHQPHPINYPLIQSSTNPYSENLNLPSHITMSSNNVSNMLSNKNLELYTSQPSNMSSYLSNVSHGHSTKIFDVELKSVQNIPFNRSTFDQIKQIDLRQNLLLNKMDTPKHSSDSNTKYLDTLFTKLLAPFNKHDGSNTVIVDNQTPNIMSKSVYQDKRIISHVSYNSLETNSKSTNTLSIPNNTVRKPIKFHEYKGPPAPPPLPTTNTNHKSINNRTKAQLSNRNGSTNKNLKDGPKANSNPESRSNTFPFSPHDVNSNENVVSADYNTQNGKSQDNQNMTLLKYLLSQLNTTTNGTNQHLSINNGQILLNSNFINMRSLVSESNSNMSNASFESSNSTLENVSSHTDININDCGISILEQLTVLELKNELKKRNLTVSGQKMQLIHRLQPFLPDIIESKLYPKLVNNNSHVVIKKQPTFSNPNDNNKNNQDIMASNQSSIKRNHYIRLHKANIARCERLLLKKRMELLNLQT